VNGDQLPPIIHQNWNFFSKFCTGPPLSLRQKRATQDPLRYPRSPEPPPDKGRSGGELIVISDIPLCSGEWRLHRSSCQIRFPSGKRSHPFLPYP